MNPKVVNQLLAGLTAPKRILSSVIAFPENIAEQKRIVFELDAMSTETGRLEMLYRNKVLDLAELKQSILESAFSCQLNSPPTQVIKEAAE